VGLQQEELLVTAPTDASYTPVALRLSDPIAQAAIRVQDRHTPELLRMPASSAPRSPRMPPASRAPRAHRECDGAGRLPSAIEGYSVIELVSGKINAMKAAVCGTSHTAKQTPPIQLGTSGGSVTDLANGFCCSAHSVRWCRRRHAVHPEQQPRVRPATSCRWQWQGVGDRDDVNAARLRRQNCTRRHHLVATCRRSRPRIRRPRPNVDCAIAQVRSGMVATTARSRDRHDLGLDRGSFGRQAVKKSGRTTSHARHDLGSQRHVTVATRPSARHVVHQDLHRSDFVSQRRSAFLNSGTRAR